MGRTVRKVDDFIQAHIEFTKGREGAEIYHKWAALAAVSAALERKVWLDRGMAGGLFYPNIYAILIGPSANGKTYSAELAIDHVKRIRRITDENEDIKFTADKLTPAVLAEQLFEAEQTFAVGERSIVQSPVFAYSGELAVYLTDIGGGSIIPDLLRFYDPGGPPELNVFKKRTISGGEITIHNPSLVLLGCTVPDYLRKVLLTETAGYGFASRTIFVVSYENDRVISNPLPEDKLLSAKLAATLAHIHTNMVGGFRESREATDRYREWYVPFRADFDERRRGMGRIEEEYYGRKKVHIFKLSMLLAAAESDDLILKPSHIEGALDLLSEIEANAFSVSENLPQTEDFYTRMEKFSYLVPKGPKTVPAEELRRDSISLFPQNREFTEALKRLKEAGIILASADPEGKTLYSRSEKNTFSKVRKDLAAKKVDRRSSGNGSDDKTRPPGEPDRRRILLTIPKQTKALVALGKVPG